VVNNRNLCAAIIILWLVALPGFLTISSVSRLVHILSLVVSGTVCLLILGYLGAIIIAQWAQWSTDCKMWITVPVCIIESADYRASGIRGYVPQQMKFQGFLCISSILKELYCLSGAPIDVLKVELWFVIEGLNFPIEQCFCLC